METSNRKKRKRNENDDTRFEDGVAVVCWPFRPVFQWGSDSRLIGGRPEDGGQSPRASAFLSFSSLPCHCLLALAFPIDGCHHFHCIFNWIVTTLIFVDGSMFVETIVETVLDLNVIRLFSMTNPRRCIAADRRRMAAPPQKPPHGPRGQRLCCAA